MSERLRVRACVRARVRACVLASAGQLLTFAQKEHLCELLHKRFAVGICDLGDPREGYSWTPYSKGCPSY